MADMIKLKIVADAKGAIKELDKLGGSFDEAGDDAEGMSDQTKMLGGALAALATAVLVAGKAVINYGDELQKTSQRIGVSVETLSEYALSAALAGTSTQQLITGVKGLAKRMGEALRSPTSAAAMAFDELNIQILDANGNFRDSDEIMGEVANQFSKMEDGTKKTQLAMDLFGRSGAELIPLLNQTAEEIAKVKVQSEVLGKVWSDDSAQAAAEFNDSLTIVKAGATGFFDTAVRFYLPALANMAKGFELLALDAAGFDDVLGHTGLSDAQILTKQLTDKTEDLAEANKELNRAQIRHWPHAIEQADLRVQRLERERRGIISVIEAEKERAQLAADQLSIEQAKAIEKIAGDLAAAFSRTAEPQERTIRATKRVTEALEEEFAVVVSLEEFRRRDVERQVSMIEAQRARMEEAVSIAQERRDRISEANEIADQAEIDANALKQARIETIEREAAERSRALQQSKFNVTQDFLQAGANAAFAIQSQIKNQESAAAKAAFAIGQGLAIASAIVNTAQAATSALASGGGVPAGIPAMAATIALGAVQVGVIAGTTISAVADSGLTSETMRKAGLNQHTAIAMRNDETVIDPVGTRHITDMLAIQREQMMTGGKSQAIQTDVTMELNGEVFGRATNLHMARAQETSQNFERNLRAS